jgi:hypothetical protein
MQPHQDDGDSAFLVTVLVVRIGSDGVSGTSVSILVELELVEVADGKSTASRNSRVGKDGIKDGNLDGRCNSVGGILGSIDGRLLGSGIVEVGSCVGTAEG